MQKAPALSSNLRSPEHADGRPRVLLLGIGGALRELAEPTLRPAHDLEFCEVAPAWEALRDNAPDLIVLDHRLLDERGQPLWIRLRREPQTQAIPLLISADSLAAAGQQAAAAGIDPPAAYDVLVPPVYDYVLLARATLRLDLQRLKRQAAARERELLASEERVRLAVESADVGTWDLDPQTGHLEFSERCYAILGFDPQVPLTYQIFLTCVHPDDRQRVEELVNVALDPSASDPGRYAAEYRVIWPDDSVRWVSARGRAMFDHTRPARPVRFLGTVIDVTDRRQFEEALKDADRRKDLFLATLAHELRNPLAPISNALQLWPLVHEDAAQMEELRGVMERQVQQMVRLIDDLLDLSRISRGRIQLRRQRVSVNTVVESAIEAVRPFIDAGQHQLVLNLLNEPLLLDGDVARLVQVFSNILHNAAKYTGRNGRIVVSSQRRDGQAVVSIADNGPGIPSQMLGRIFDMFTQVDATLERSHGGLGIGLTLVKTLVQMHGGRIEARSAGPGHGAEFIVSLPLAQDAVAEFVPPIDDVRSTLRIPTLKVLVVDDVPPSAQTLSLMLTSVGQRTQMAFDGPAALEAVARFRPDVVFLDIAMPGMNGYEVARRIRSQADQQDVVLVALTGYGQDEDRRLAQEAGFNRHLVKPITLDVLLDVLVQTPARG